LLRSPVAPGTVVDHHVVKTTLPSPHTLTSLPRDGILQVGSLFTLGYRFRVLGIVGALGEIYATRLSVLAPWRISPRQASIQAPRPGHAGVMNIFAALPFVSYEQCGCCSILGKREEQRSVLVRGLPEAHSSTSPQVRISSTIAYVPKSARPSASPSPQVSAFPALPGPRELAVRAISWRIRAQWVIHYPCDPRVTSYRKCLCSSAFQHEWRTLQKNRKRVQAELHHAEQVLETRSEQLRNAKAELKTRLVEVMLQHALWTLPTASSAPRRACTAC
jgi:hypothetical protein